MLDSALLRALHYGASLEERQEALEELKEQERRGKVSDKDLLPLLNSQDSYLQAYAIGGLGRIQAQSGIQPLKALFAESENPLLLTTLLEAFCDYGSEYGSEDFGPLVLKRITARSNWLGKERPSSEEDFLRNQILVPALKYFQISGFPKASKVLQKLIRHQDAMVRYHALLLFHKLNRGLKPEQIKDLLEDHSPRVAQLAREITQELTR